MKQSGCYVVMMMMMVRYGVGGMNDKLYYYGWPRVPGQCQVTGSGQATHYMGNGAALCATGPWEHCVEMEKIKSLIKVTE